MTWWRRRESPHMSGRSQRSTGLTVGYLVLSTGSSKGSSMIRAQRKGNCRPGIRELRDGKTSQRLHPSRVMGFAFSSAEIRVETRPRFWLVVGAGPSRRSSCPPDGMHSWKKRDIVRSRSSSSTRRTWSPMAKRIPPPVSGGARLVGWHITAKTSSRYASCARGSEGYARDQWHGDGHGIPLSPSVRGRRRSS